MKTIKSYEDFCNEEISIKKSIIGTALGACLLAGGTLTSCKKEILEPIEIAQKDYTNKILIKKVIESPTDNELVEIKNVSGETISLNNWEIRDSYGNTKVLWGDILPGEKKSYGHQSLGFYINDDIDIISISDNNANVINKYETRIWYNGVYVNGIRKFFNKKNINYSLSGDLNMNISNLGIFNSNTTFGLISGYNSIVGKGVNINIDGIDYKGLSLNFQVLDPGEYDCSQISNMKLYKNGISFLSPPNDYDFVVQNGFSGDGVPLTINSTSGRIIISDRGKINVVLDASGRHYIVDQSNREGTYRKFEVKFVDCEYEINGLKIKVSDITSEFVDYSTYTEE